MKIDNMQLDICVLYPKLNMHTKKCSVVERSHSGSPGVLNG